ncbi:MAG: UDP-3-O-(3-hydroxymyristoyl)glucosamine N-acyltransferase [Campylobacterota bacterium]|nr:UDP-3-O-(3-hydroxymyristoyl)glucosamine N-acyltransferase [Campylobacterota bacterium]
MKLFDIAKQLEFDIDNSIDIEISGLNTLIDANPDQISFLDNKKYLKDLESTKAGAVFISEDFKDIVPTNTIALVVSKPYLSLAYASRFFSPSIIEKNGNEPIVGSDTIVMPNCYIGKNTLIGNNCNIMAGSYIGDNVTIGNNTTIYPNVTIYRDCIIGNNTIIHAGTVIGSDGFGFATTQDGEHVKIYQNGNVVVGDDVEIGSNTSIDRAAFNSTIIEDKVRIDNLVHIAHNCKIGYGSIITGQCGFAGSTILNEYVVVGAQSGFAGHLEIAAFTTISAKSGVTKTIKEPKKQWAGFPLMEHKTWLRLQGKINKLLKG